MRRYKKSIALGVVILLLVGLGVYVGTDKARQRVILVTAIEAWTGGTFQIEGDVSFSIGRISSFSAERVTFALPGAGSANTVGRVRVSIDTWSAVNGPLFVEEMVVEQGRIRIDGFPGPDRAPAEAADGEVSLPIVQRIEIIDTQLDFATTTPDEYSTITIDKLTVRQVGDRRELEIAGEGLFDDVAMALNGGIGPFEETQNATVNAPIRLAFSSPGGHTTAVGTILDVFGDAELDVTFILNGSPDGVLDRLLDPLALHDARINVSGKLLGPIARPRVADLEARIENDGFFIELMGKIDDAAYGAGIDILFNGGFGGDYLHRLFVDIPQSLGLEQVNAGGRVKGALTRIDLSGLDVRVHLAGQARLSASGQVILTDALSDLKVSDADLSIQLSAPTAQLLGNLIDDNLNTLGPIEGEAHFAGNDGTVALERIDLRAGKGEKVRLRATGRIPWIAGNITKSLEATELMGELTGDDTKDLTPLLGTDMPSIGAITLRTAIRPRGDDVDFTDIMIEISGLDDLQITATGEARLHDVPGASFLDGIDAAVQTTGSTSTTFLQTFGVDLPELGPITGTAQITGNEDTVSIRSIDMRFGETKNLNVGVIGSIDRFDLLNDGKVSDLDLNVTVASPSVMPIAQLMDLDLPELGRVTSTARIIGDGDRLSAQSIDMRFGETDDLNIAVTGRIDRIDLISEGQYRGLDLNVTVTAPAVGSIAQLADVDLPELGPVRATARLQDRDKGSKLAVETFSADVGAEGGPVLSITGDFDNILEPQMGVMQATVRADSVKLSKAMNWPLITGLETITADMEVTARDGSLGIERLTMTSADSDAISLTAHGAIDDLLNFDQVDLDIVLNAPEANIFDPALQGIMQPMGALDIDGKVVVAKPDMRFEGGIRLGNNDIDAKLNVSTVGERPKLTGQITAERLKLDEFGIDARSRKVQEPASGDNLEKQRDHVFTLDPLPFENLFAADLDLAVTVDSGQGLGHPFDALQAQVRLQDGRLSLDPFKVSYEGGNVEASGVLDASVVPPAVELRLRGTDFKLDELLLYAQAEPTAAGDLTGEFNLQSSGSSPHELAENLSGTADLALENGRVNGINLHVLSNETLEYLFSLPNLTQSTEVRCAIARFDIEAGVAKSQALLIATPSMTLSGAGGVDFGGEKLDITVSADPKSFTPVIFKKPVRIHGEFLDLDYSTAGTTPGLLGGLFGTVAGFVAAPFIFAPVSAAGTLAGLLAESGTESPCLIDQKPPRN